MKVENKTYWDSEEVIATQDQTETYSTRFERFLFSNAKKRLEDSLLTLQNVKIFGCGTGRDISEIVKFYGDTNIIASDISDNMIKKCNLNIELWKLKNIETVVADAAVIQLKENTFQLVTILNSMLTYVHDSKQREVIFNKSYQILQENGCIIGTVHNQVGVFSKTIFFQIRHLFKFFLKDDVGHRYSGSKGFRVKAYYFTKKGLIQSLEKAKFRNIEVYSLEEFYNLEQDQYDRKRGYNNLIFIAQK